jgi:hypothetical protein
MGQLDCRIMADEIVEVSHGKPGGKALPIEL